MPYTKTPSESTYQTKKIRLVKELGSRNSTADKDDDFLNYFPELLKNKTTKEDELLLVKRDGSAQFAASLTPLDVRGMFYWELRNKLFLAIDDDVYVLNGSTGATITTLSAVFSTTTGVVSFCEFLYDDGSVKIVTTDGVKLSAIDDSNTVVACTDADMPVHLPYLVFLDGYLFILKVDTADLYNSALNDPLSWVAGEFISAEMIPDRATWLTRLNNYILVAGNQSMEIFWDAAVATGSPLQRFDAPVKLTGLIGGMAAVGNNVFCVASNNTAQPEVFMLQDLKLTPISNEAIRRHLASLTITSLSTIKGACVSLGGHSFYVMNTGTYCYAYDLDSKLWSRWAYGSGTNFNFSQWICVETPVGYKTLFTLSGDSTIYYTSPSLYQDNGTTFTCRVVTDNQEFDTLRQKTMSRLIVLADDPPTGTTSTGTIYWSDDDYKTWSSGLSVDLLHERPNCNRLGRFRRRAIKWEYTQNQPHRLNGFEVELNMGPY